MLSKTMQDVINKQIARELDAAYTYLGIAAYCSQEQYNGFANYFRVQTQEELFHASKMITFVLDAGGKIDLPSIASAKTEFGSLMDVLDASIAHEKENTKGVHEVADLAITEKDHATRTFFDWFVTEQVEEEANFEQLIHQLKLVGQDGQGVYLMDKELALRVFSMPTTTAQV